jgi:hypothetical protein
LDVEKDNIDLELDEEISKNLIDVRARELKNNDIIPKKKENPRL